MIERHLAKLRVRHQISKELEDVIAGAISEVREVASDKVIVRQNERVNHSTLILDGWLCRYKDLLRGQRQITQLHIAGDFADMHSFTLKKLDHNVMTLSPCTLAFVPHDTIREITERYPDLARIYWFGTNLDAAIHREWELSLGQRSAASRLAHLLCELRVRLQVVGLADESGYDLPLTQAELSECTGMTPVHLNRMLKELRTAGLAEHRDQRLIIHDLKGLERYAEFNPAYLYMEQVQP